MCSLSAQSESLSQPSREPPIRLTQTFVAVPVLLAAAYVTVYSFVVYRRQRTT
jgi:hypothetical protein